MQPGGAPGQMLCSGQMFDLGLIQLLWLVLMRCFEIMYRSTLG